ncbi:TCF3 fusion partner-like protein [Frankliniella fusca]|uniref:TCF3 fusion partner-like protein n=1 Tax=Frankliniella fusca TaxID=407009 RepID=A0AAE1GSW7_9NEOP|nr:TCF3 fusion partner-like protein [Frankliniella fusca]
MNGPGSDSNSDDTDEEVDAEEEDVYRRKYQLLLERCEVLQQDNERLVHRAQQVKKLLRRIRRERKILMERLDTYGDNWRNVPITFERDEIMTPQQPIKKEKTSTPGTGGKAGGAAAKNQGTGEKGRKNANNNSTGTPNTTSSSKRKTAKGDKPEKDPNAPKRPANPFLQFCQEQRPLAVTAAGLERASGNSEGETSKQEITRQLASKWNTLAPEDKKVYYDMYEKSKEKYAEEMKLYSANNRAKTPSDDNPS